MTRRLSGGDMGKARLGPAAALVLVGLAGAAVGCVMPDQVARIQKDVADLQQQVLETKRAQEASKQKLAAMEAALAGSDAVKRSDFADLKLRFDEVSRQAAATEERVRESDRRIDRLSQDLQAARELARRASALGATPGTDGSLPGAPAAGGAGAAPPAGALPNPEALYNTAYADFSKGSYALAISGFQEYAARFPESALADNALYWIGECLYSQGKLSDAVQAFDRMLESYPASDRAAAANLKKGLAFLEQNQVAQAIVQLRFVVATYPGSDEARIAKEKLSSLAAR